MIELILFQFVIISFAVWTLVSRMIFRGKYANRNPHTARN